MASKSSSKLDPARLPLHVAIIMDGNGRWAKKRSLPRIAGHKVGMDSVRAVVKGCDQLGVRFLTLYAFSNENWRRPRAEVTFLMKLLEIYLRAEVEELHANNVIIESMGRITELPSSAQKELKKAQEKTSGNTGLTLTLALNYGGRQEIIDAVNALPASKRRGKIIEADIAGSLYSPHVPDPDLVIRTSGEMRLSNFLLWQAAYAELYVTPVYWPDFRKPQLKKALLDYQKRERRFGDVRARSGV